MTMMKEMESSPEGISDTEPTSQKQGDEVI